MSVKKISKKPNEKLNNKIIETLRKELKRKDEEIERLKEEKEILFRVSLKNTKRKLEEDKIRNS